MYAYNICIYKYIYIYVYTYTQAQQLSRLTAEMQADADQQRQAIETRLQSVLERKQRYMQHIIVKAQAASELRGSLAESREGGGGGGEGMQRERDREREKSGRGGRKEDGVLGIRPKKAMRKRMRKFRQVIYTYVYVCVCICVYKYENYD